MSIRTSPWPPGVPCWVDLIAPDVAAAKAFYGAVLGWSYADTEADYGGYAIAEAGGAAAAASGPSSRASPRRGRCISPATTPTRPRPR
ncbi:MAG: hypothetical protein M3P96_04880 [Actinomycetota bacterium]|nr:hypothetical protein [Actinomycetota bacterium]